RPGDGPNVAGHPAAPSTPSRPLVPAPTKKSRPPRPSASAIRATAAAICDATRPTAATARWSSRFMSRATRNGGRRSRSRLARFGCSVSSLANVDLRAMSFRLADCDADPVRSCHASRAVRTRRARRRAWGAASRPGMFGWTATVVVDLQGVGARYYTFIWTTALVMRAAAAAGVEVVVLDRPNPLGGALIEGNVADPAYASFVGLYPLAIRHGLTIGELAVYLNEQHAIGCHLTVVPMRGWRRAMLWEDTGLPSVAPSPD